MKWKDKLISSFIKQLGNNNKLTHLLKNEKIKIHLAVFKEPFSSLIFSKTKTIESRFSINNIPPFKVVQKGDIILIKKSGGFVCGFFQAGKVINFQDVTPREISVIKNKYNTSICGSYETGFWEKRKKSKYITLIEIKNINTVEPFAIAKKDRRAWVVINYSR